jgi:thymidine phosphorylase
MRMAPEYRCWNTGRHDNSVRHGRSHPRQEIRGPARPEQIDWLIDAYTRGVVADEQMSSMAMAVFFQGLDDAELSRWTAAMIASGHRLDFSGLSRPTVDKHSTGGVGDKITLPLAPLVAACGAAVPQLSGRGPGPHRRHPGQDGGHPRLAGEPVQ